MKVVAFLMEHAVVDRIINHLGITFVAEKPPPSQPSSRPRSWRLRRERDISKLS